MRLPAGTCTALSAGQGTRGGSRVSPLPGKYAAAAACPSHEHPAAFVLIAAFLLAATAHAQGWYRAPQVAPSSFANSSRLDALVRANQLYLSLPDAIAVALENNLDIELQRFATRIADTDVLRARGGGQLRGVTMTVSELPQSVITPGEPLITSAAGGAALATSIIANVADVYPVTGATTNLSVNGGTTTVAVPFSSGPPIPTYDPAVNGQLTWQHQTTPQINPASYGVPALVARNLLGNVGLTAGFSPGTSPPPVKMPTVFSLSAIGNSFSRYRQHNFNSITHFRHKAKKDNANLFALSIGKLIHHSFPHQII